jgi:hypothetical protein
VRRPIASKPDTCTETADVNAAGRSGKVTRITLGGLIACLWLPPLRSGGMGDQKSAEAKVGDDRPLKGGTCGTDWVPDPR